MPTKSSSNLQTAGAQTWSSWARKGTDQAFCMMRRITFTTPPTNDLSASLFLSWHGCSWAHFAYAGGWISLTSLTSLLLGAFWLGKWIKSFDLLTFLHFWAHFTWAAGRDLILRKFSCLAWGVGAFCPWRWMKLCLRKFFMLPPH